MAILDEGELLAMRRQNAWEIGRRIASSARVRALRTMREFAEQMIIIPDGQYKGMPYSCDYQPYSALWFDEVDSGRWRRVNSVGPTQSGKTLTCYVVPMLYYLFEVGESVIGGLPDMNMATDKWDSDIRPVIESSFPEYLPAAGAGSRGGKFDSIRFRNGAVLKWMSAGGNDKKRAGFTSRVLVVTETDGFDESGETSREADKLTQMEGRLRADLENAVTFMECTVSIAKGRTWREYVGGSETKIVLQCLYCRGWVTPEREHVMGWQAATSALDAREASHWCCPKCGHKWVEPEREAMNRVARVVHRGQCIDDNGQVTGDLPRTDTLGFRWSAVNNLFMPVGFVGEELWKRDRAANEENAEKEICQFTFAVPYDPPVWEQVALTQDGIFARALAKYPARIVPEDVDHVTSFVDVGKWSLYWASVAWRIDGSSVVCDYGVHPVHTGQFGEKEALALALREMRDQVFAVGYGREDGGPAVVPTQVWIDTGYAETADVVYAFVREDTTERFRAYKGHGSNRKNKGGHSVYTQPKTKGGDIVFVGENFHVVKLKARGAFLFEVNVDYWKTFTHERLAQPMDAPGAMALHAGSRAQHLKFVKQLLAEECIEEFVPGEGVRKSWVVKSRANHWLDCVTGCSAAGWFCGVRVLKEIVAVEAEPREGVPSVAPMPEGIGGRAFFVGDR